ncbi:MAG TPA: NAD(P)-dependent oxidoreductase [Nitrososphaeraceae archaeon]|nr:NAD(P)-dependent oxidoreductase [Nitrososphaeraceae archaeon]
MILSYAAGLTQILSGKLKEFGLTAERVDYNKPILTQITDADVLVNGLGKVDKHIIDACPKLKLIHQVGTGFDNIDIGYCTQKSIYVANIPHVNYISVAEHTLFLMIYLAKNMKNAGEGLMKRRVLNVLGSELYGKKLTIIGLGSTGVEVAKRAKAFGMYITAVTKHPNSKKGRRIDKNNNNNNNIRNYFVNIIQGVEALSDSLIDADYISIHTPLTDETRGLIGAKEINLMKSSAFLINVARAQIVDREGLFTSLVNKKIAGAAFDVFWEEPADPNDKLLKLDNFVLTPHLAGWTSESADHATRIIASNINRILHGEKPSTVVNSD